MIFIMGYYRTTLYAIYFNIINAFDLFQEAM